MDELKSLREQINKELGKKIQLENTVKEDSKNVLLLKKKQKHLEEAREIIREVGLQTQKKLEYHISDVTSLALDSVFPDPYKLTLNFHKKRNKTECKILFERGDMKLDPIEETGGGAVDIGAFALRVASWAMSYPRLRNVMILDEPMKNISEEYHEVVSGMIKTISQKLNIQFIIVTHNTTLAKFADKEFKLRKDKKGVTKIIKR